MKLSSQEISKYAHEYIQPDATVLYHDNDPALKPIRLKLPNPPSLELIDGYGLPAKDQRFKRHELPYKLARLEQIALKEVNDKANDDKSYTITYYKVQRKFWEILQDKSDYYAEEIKWIKKVWWHYLNGYWFFCNGKPTYITGAHYFYLNFWKIDGQFYPDYRDRDRKEFIFFHYSWTTKETFANLDKDGYAIANEDGTYDMIEMPNRTSFGVGQNKHRRSGNTNKGLVMGWWITAVRRGTDGFGVMSMSGDNAEAHMKKKMIPSWNKMPMFLKPLTKSNTNPKSIENNTPSNEIGVDSLENAVTAAGTAEASFYDGKKLWAILVDESGKCEKLDVRERHGVVQHCISEGNGTIIFGWEYQPSTAEELAAGGKAFKGLLDDSNFYKRNKETGQTRSGLFRLFIPADEGLAGYIDPYGGSVCGKKLLPEHQKMGYKTTSTITLEAERKQLLNDSKIDPEAMVTYRMKKKQFPLCYDDSWIGGAGDIGFDVDILDKTIAGLSRGGGAERFDLEWTGNRFRSVIKLIPNPISGRFWISKLLPDNEANQIIKDSFIDPVTGADIPTFRPKYPNRFTCGADPFRFKTETQARLADSNGKSGKTASKGSDGGIAIFWHRDQMIDPDDKPASEWESNRFVLTYRYRPENNEVYTEDVLKACIYFGAMCYPETNERVVWQKFHEWGYDGFLKYGMTLRNGEYVVNKDPGITSLERSKQEGFNEIRTHISIHGKREKHEDLLLEWKNINSMEEMTKYDLLAASMCALLGAKSQYGKIVEEENEFNYDIEQAFYW